MTPNLNIQPDIKISVKQVFGIDSELKVEGFSKKNEYVPDIDKHYKFDRDTTLAIIAGFKYNKKVIIHGYHGTGKSTHIEQIAARLNWPCIRVNLDSKENFEKRFGGVLYIFLRGMLQREGVFFFRPGWNDLLDYERILSLEKY